MIKIEHLTFRYKDQTNLVFEEAKLEITDGIWLLEGENGSGKSTFLKLLNNPAHEIGELDDRTIINVDGNIVFLDRDSSLPLNLNEVDIAQYIFSINKIREKEYNPIHKNRPLASYSIGERKMVTLKILSYLNIDILLIDEYITNIDEFNVIEAMNILKMLYEKDTLIVISSNEADIKKRFNNKISIVNKKLMVSKNE